MVLQVKHSIICLGLGVMQKFGEDEIDIGRVTGTHLPHRLKSQDILAESQ